MSTHHLHRKTVITAPLDDVFEFFSRAENLAELTPETLQFKILSPLPIEMKPGAMIDYRIKLFGVGFNWKTEIVVWEQGKRFVDEQRKGPYRTWIHEHRFEASGSETLMTDDLTYEAPGWILEPLITAVFVRPQVEGIFNFRQKKIQERFGIRSDDK